MLERQPFDSLEVGQDYIALSHHGEQVVDFHNECMLISTKLHNRSLTLVFVKIEGDGYLHKGSEVHLIFDEATIEGLDIDNDLNDYTTLEALKILETGEWARAKVEIADMSLLVGYTTLRCMKGRASDALYSEARNRYARISK